MLSSREFRTLRAASALLLAAVACVLPLTPAHAAGTSTLPIQSLNEVPPVSTNTFDITIGAGVAQAPRYPGSGRYETKPIYFGSFSYKRLAFLGPSGLGASLIDTGGLRAGPVFGYEGGRRESIDPRLAGLGNLQAGIMAGAFLAYRFGDFELRATARQAVTHSNKGVVGRVQLDYFLSFPEHKIDLQFGPEVDFGDARHVRSWYGISAAQSLRSGRPAYLPRGGLIDYGAHAIATYHWSESVFLRFTVDLRQYVDDVADSPIVDTKSQAYVSLGLGYRFQLDDSDLDL